MIIDPSRVLPQKYQELIQIQENREDIRIRSLDFSYTGQWTLPFNEPKGVDADFFENHLAGQTLIDFGGAFYGLMSDFAIKYGAKNYINVDRFNIRSLPKLTDPLGDPILKNTGTRKRTLMIEVASDMLNYVTRVRDNVTNCVINGIDFNIIDDDRYNEAMGEEMIRVTRKGGLIFGNSSEALYFIQRLIEDGRAFLKEIKLKWAHDCGTSIFEKTE